MYELAIRPFFFQKIPVTFFGHIIIHMIFPKKVSVMNPLGQQTLMSRVPPCQTEASTSKFCVLLICHSLLLGFLKKLQNVL
jgi:hypothetical protein